VGGFAGDGRRLVTVWGGPPEDPLAVLSPTPKQTLLARGEGARVWDLTAQDPVTASASVEGSVWVSPDRRWLGASRTTGPTRLWDLSDQMPVERDAIVLSADPLTLAEFSSDGTHLAGGDASGRVLLHELKRGGQTFLSPKHFVIAGTQPPKVVGLKFSPTRRR